MKRKNILALLLAMCLCFGLFSVCAYAAEEDGEEAAEGEEALVEYAVAGVGTFYLPAGWGMESGVMEGGPLPTPYVQFTRDDMTVRVNLFTQEVYDASGAAMPADLEEYSQRPGPQKDLPEGGAYALDEYGNLSVSYTEDGRVTYLILMEGNGLFATAGIFYPEGVEDAELIPQWISKTVLDAAAEGLQRYDAEGVGVFYLPSDWEMETGSIEEPLPQTYAEFTNGDITIRGVRFGADAYEAAGVPLPADVEEYSTRDGVRRGLPEDAEFAYDDFGNFYVEYTQDGTVTYTVLKQGDESMGSLFLTYPEGTEVPEDVYLWLSLAVIE